MSIPTFTAPILTYVGSVDTTSAGDVNDDFGTNQFIISIDPSMSDLGSLLMFEYKLQDAGTTTDPSNVTLGYINMDAGTSFQIGNASEYQVGVPAEDNLTYNLTREIQIRAYTGLLGMTDIVVSPWSNLLVVHNPPTQPVIEVSYYDVDAVGGADDLFVVLNPTSNEFINWANTQFVVAFYYLDQNSSDTVWQVSEPVNAEDVTYDGNTNWKLLRVESFGVVSTTVPEVYVSVYAINSFQDSDENTFYSVSRISSTVYAGPAADYSAPILTNIAYQVYEDPNLDYPGDQDMDISWLPPQNSILPTFFVDYYILEYVTDLSGTWTVIADDISANVLTYTFNPWNNGIECGNTVYYRVRAISTLGTSSPYSNVLSKNIFAYASAPQNLSITNSSFVDGLVSFDVNFEAPVEFGCGNTESSTFIVNILNVIEGVDTIVYTQTVAYDPETTTYTINIVDLAIEQIGFVDVYMKTQDTNTPFAYVGGETASAGYVGISIAQAPIVYQVYTNGLQIMDLSWSIGELPSGWTLSDYQVYLSVNGGAYALETTVENTFYNYNVTQDCDNNLAFKIEVTATFNGENYLLLSNIESKNVFKYSEAPASTLVDWALVDPSGVIVDLYVNWTNPANTGCGDPVSFTIEVQDLSGVVLQTVTDISYNPLGGTYYRYINDIPYVDSGNVKIYLQTVDTNSSDLENGSQSSTSFISQNLPFISNVVFNGDNSAVTFTVETAGDLVLVNGIINVVNGSTPVGVEIYSYYTGTPPDNQTVTDEFLENGVHKYTFTIQAAIFAGGFGDAIVLVFSNSVGISNKPQQVPPL